MNKQFFNVGFVLLVGGLPQPKNYIAQVVTSVCVSKNEIQQLVEEYYQDITQKKEIAMTTRLGGQLRTLKVAISKSDDRKVTGFWVNEMNDEEGPVAYRAASDDQKILVGSWMND